MGKMEEFVCDKCSIHHFYDGDQYYNQNGDKIKGGAWCHWCDSGYLCLDHIVLVDDYSCTPIRKTCCKTCHKEGKCKVPQTRFVYKFGNEKYMKGKIIKIRE